MFRQTPTDFAQFSPPGAARAGVFAPAPAVLHGRAAAIRALLLPLDLLRVRAH